MDTLTRAQPPLDFIPPTLNPWVLKGAQVLLPLWLKWFGEPTTVETQHVERLVDLYQQFQAGKIRLMLAFRHPSPDDSFCLGYLMWNALPKTAQRLGVRLTSPVHAHFIYDRGIPLWAGQGVGWLYSQLGGTPIQRGKVDIPGLRCARNLFANGQVPIAASPEGANNGHNEIISPLEPGIAQLGFWCVEDLRKAGRDEAVLLVPIGLQYQYLTPPWNAVEALITQLESESGLAHTVDPNLVAQLMGTLPDSDLPPQHLAELYGRLYRLGEHILNLMERYYREFYHRVMPELEPSGGMNAQLTQRLQRLLVVALEVAETYFDLQPKGSVIDRCRRIEQAGWDWIYREELRDSEAVSAIERGLADRIAEEASLRMWHMRVVESFVAVTGRYVMEKPTAERFAETTLLLRDTVMRLEGRNPFPRPQLGRQKARVTIGEPLVVSDRWLDYKANRRQAVSDLTQDLQFALESMIVT